MTSSPKWFLMANYSPPDTAPDNKDVAPAAVEDSGIAALRLVSAYHRVPVHSNQLKHEIALGQRASSAEDIVRIARRLGFKSRLSTRFNVARLKTVPMPIIAELADGSGFAIVAARVSDTEARVIDPITQRVEQLAFDEVMGRLSGRVVLVARRALATPGEGRFGLHWFLPSIWRYRRPLTQVIAASLFIQICALVTPLLFQITIDKVLVHESYSTLVFVVVGLVLIGAFQSILQYLRSYALTHTTSRIDIELGARLFDHLLRLPLLYFETRPTGQTVARVREIETIRSFLTGQGLSSAIDLVFTVIFIAVLMIYSPFLTLIVLVSLPVYVLVAAVLRPPLRNKTNERFNRGAASQQFLVESVVGIQTVKASAIEPHLRSQWEDRLASYVRSSFEAVNISSVGQNVIQFISKITSALVLFFGAQAVMKGDLTVGQLIAFNMIMGQVTGPILRLSQLWQDFQQVQISVERIGDVLNTPPESRALAQAHLPRAKGEIKIERLTFRYAPNAPETLKHVSLAVAQGQVIGIVGPSGSGKSTLTKLIQRLYLPESGQILIDGIDIAQVDPAWLRRQIGVVLQENLLFNRTVHDNISIGNPGMARDQVIRLARLSGADEFINKLPLGYDTLIEERGLNLSGGQRQRIAIARALSNNPAILIFDEATSALDYESERIIQNNMKEIVRGRTVIIIAHRLAAVRNCNRIIGVQDGRIVEDGTHLELINRPSSLYGRLWRMQVATAEEEVA